MEPDIISISDIDKTHVLRVGGKAANLGELKKIAGINVPDGFCITTRAWNDDGRWQKPGLNSELFEGNSGNLPARFPKELLSELKNHLAKFPPDQSFAIRSSATAEDLPTASFAGQYDSYLNISGVDNIIEHIVKCGTSLYNERAIQYRKQNYIQNSKIKIAVIVQVMVPAEAAGILFTADPLTSNRNISSIDAGYGLGESIVAGKVTPDTYQVSKEKVIASKNSGQQVLTDSQILKLETIGRRIEKHLNSPQDIEWCLYEDDFYIVQSRPITTLFPIPAAPDPENRVYLSVGHQQMMTDAMKPLGLSLFLMSTMAPMRTAGGRLFVDATRMLSTVAGRTRIIDTLGNSDLLYKSALQDVLNKEGFLNLEGSDDLQHPLETTWKFKPQIENDPAIVTNLISKNHSSRHKLEEEIKTKSGPELFEFIRNDFKELKTLLTDPVGTNVFMTAMEATTWINEKVEEWLGEKNVGDILSQSIPNNITSEMGLALMDISDVIRPYPEIISFLENTTDKNFPDKLESFDGGIIAKKAFTDFLSKYGMRCSGEIDIGRTRWSEYPLLLVSLILNNINFFEPGFSRKRFEDGLIQALAKKEDILSRLRQLPGGLEKAAEAEVVINYIRNYMGYREYPKYFKIAREFVYKKALLKEASQLVSEGFLSNEDDIFFLYFDELQEFVLSKSLDPELIAKRKEEFNYFSRLKPPRVLCSDGEIFNGRYERTDLPENILMGMPVSSGVVEGRARIILDMHDANLQQGDILVTKFTDPGWTPLFVSVAGLITEIGGLMTHGAVIAREYGLPAIVGVQNATTIIKDGQRIRLDASNGFVELL